jgi:hypothetical protein
MADLDERPDLQGLYPRAEKLYNEMPRKRFENEQSS